MQKFFHINFPNQLGRLQLLQDYMARPYLFLTAILGMVILVLLSRHQDVLWPGIIGSFTIIVLGNTLGNLYAKNAFLEIGFSEEFFYMRSAYDIANGADYKMYPLAYANATRQGDVIMVNYIEQNVKLRRSDWKQYEELWHHFHYYNLPEV